MNYCKKTGLITLITFFCVMTAFAQKDTISLMKDDIHQVYNYNKKLDIPLTAVPTGLYI